jgi:hypothetical protein
MTSTLLDRLVNPKLISPIQTCGTEKRIVSFSWKRAALVTIQKLSILNKSAFLIFRACTLIETRNLSMPKGWASTA